MKLHFEQAGAGTPIVFTSGIAHTREVWAGISTRLESRASVLSWDHRGHGASEWCADPQEYSAALAVDDLLSMIVAAGGGPHNPAVLVGHSLGGYLSLRAAIGHPGLVKALVLVATGPGFRDQRAREEWNRFALGMTMPCGVDEEARRLGQQSDAAVIEGLRGLSIPTLVIVGSQDRRFLAGKDYLVARLPDASALVIDGGRHCVHQTHADQVSQAIGEFLEAKRLIARPS